MFQRRLKLKQWWDKLFANRIAAKTKKQVRTGGMFLPILSFLWKLIILLFFCSLIVFPFYYMISVSLMTKEETELTTAKLVPDVPQWSNYAKAFYEGYWNAVLITSVVTGFSIFLKIIITMLMGYAFSLIKWRFKKIIWLFFLALLMVPEVALLFGQYQVIVGFNLQIGNQIIIALILPFIASVFSAYMYRNAFEAIPIRTKEASFVDGASGFKYFVKIAFPMVSPTTWTVAILTGFAAWNSYTWPSLLLSGSNIDVINTWLFKTAIGEGADGRVMMNVRMAAAIIAIIPMFIVYFLFRSRIMKAVSRQGSAIKG